LVTLIAKFLVLFDPLILFIKKDRSDFNLNCLYLLLSLIGLAISVLTILLSNFPQFSVFSFIGFLGALASSTGILLFCISIIGDFLQSEQWETFKNKIRVEVEKMRSQEPKEQTEKPTDDSDLNDLEYLS
jgi:hypothetical protein